MYYMQKEDGSTFMHYAKVGMIFTRTLLYNQWTHANL